MPEIISYPYTLDNFHEIKDNLELSLVMERTVLYSDVDINQHFNNSRYIEWAFDVMPIEFLKITILRK